MDGYFGHSTEKIPGNNRILFIFPSVLPRCRPTSLLGTVTSNSNGIQGVCLRGARDKNSSTYTFGLQEEQQKDIETSIETMSLGTPPTIIGQQAQ